jgi:hypothetical protein
VLALASEYNSSTEGNQAIGDNMPLGGEIERYLIDLFFSMKYEVMILKLEDIAIIIYGKNIYYYRD